MKSSFLGAHTSDKAPHRHQAAFGYLEGKHGEFAGRRAVHDASAISNIEFRAVAGAQQIPLLRNPFRNVASGVGADRRISEYSFRRVEARAFGDLLGGQTSQNHTIQTRSFSHQAALRVHWKSGHGRSTQGNVVRSDDLAFTVALGEHEQIIHLRSIHTWIGFLSCCPIDRPETEPYPQSRLQDLSPADESNEGMRNAARDFFQFGFTSAIEVYSLERLPACLRICKGRPSPLRQSLTLTKLDP